MILSSSRLESWNVDRALTSTPGHSRTLALQSLPAANLTRLELSVELVRHRTRDPEGRLPLCKWHHNAGLRSSASVPWAEDLLKALHLLNPPRKTPRRRRPLLSF